jgi:hypothetical protein
MQVSKRFKDIAFGVKAKTALCFVYDPLSEDVKHLRAKHATRGAVMIISHPWTADIVEELRVKDVGTVGQEGWLWGPMYYKWQREVCVEPILRSLPGLRNLRSFEYAPHSS